MKENRKSVLSKKYRVAIYIRVSTKKQVEEGYSLDAQRDRLVKLCELNGYIIYKMYADEGKSGKDTNRPALKQMMEDMEAGCFDKILVMKLDRISRSLVDLELMIKEMQKCNVDFESASEKIDTTSSFGMMFVRLLGIFAQFERERIAERINDTFEDMINNNRPITGCQPLGYKIGKDKNGNKIVVIDEEKEAMVREIFDLYEKNHSLRRTLFYINEKYGTTMDIHALSKTISWTHYYGTYKGKDNYCPAYITKERWDKIQAIKTEGKSIKVYNANRFYLFSKLLFDVHCGTKLTGNTRKCTGGETYYYRCSKHIHSKLCKTNAAINELWLEEYLINNLNEYINDYFEKIKQEYEISKIEYKDNTKQIASLKEELKRTNILFTKGRIEEEDYEKEYIRISNKISKLEKEPKKKDTSNLVELKKINWKEMYYSLSREQKQAWWQSLIKKIIIDPFKYKEGKEYVKVYFL